MTVNLPNVLKNFNCKCARFRIISIKAKISRAPFKQLGCRATQMLELIHTDVCGPMASMNSIGGSRYMLIFLDDFTRMVFMFTMKTKYEVFEKFKEFKNMVESQSGLKSKR